MDHAEFGRYLMQQRELRGLSRAEVARATKIPPLLLEALERGEKAKLPERVFVLNFVRAYATTIGLEPEEAVLRFQELEGQEHAPTLSEPAAGHPVPAPRGPASTRAARRMAALAVLLLLVVLAVWAARGFA